jgi:hypothetical protein
VVCSHNRPRPLERVRRRESFRPAVALRHGLALLLVVALAGGCSTMKPLRGAPAQAIADLPKDARVRVLLRNGEHFELSFVRVEADSVHGLVRIPREGAPYYDPGEARFVAYAQADIQEMKAMQPDTGRTVTLVLAGALVVGGALAVMFGRAMARSDWSFGPSSR